MISQDLLNLANANVPSYNLTYRKIKINGRPTIDSLSRKSSSFLVQFIIEEQMKEGNKHFFCLKMTRNDSKSFTVYFRVTMLAVNDRSLVEILYVSGKEMAGVYNRQKQNTDETNTKELKEKELKELKELKQIITNKLMKKDESNVLEFDTNRLLKNLIITDDEGVNTYKFYTTESREFFEALSSMRDCFTD